MVDRASYKGKMQTSLLECIPISILLGKGLNAMSVYVQSQP